VKGLEQVEVGSLMIHGANAAGGGNGVMHTPCHGWPAVLYSVGVPVRNLALKVMTKCNSLQIRGVGQEGEGSFMMHGGKQGGTIESLGSCLTSPKMKER
jgi:hypothetical protein